MSSDRIMAGAIRAAARAPRPGASTRTVPARQAVGMTPGRVPVARGFSLIEILVSIIVIAAVLSITLPALSLAKDRARVAVSLAGHREVLASLGGYTRSNGGRHPFIFARRVGSYTDWRYEIGDPHEHPHEPGFDPLPVHLQARSWATLVSPRGLGGVLYPTGWESIRARDEDIGLVTGSYVASSTMFARPAYFSGELENARHDHIGATAAHRIAFPSSKILFEDLESWGLLANTPQRRRASYGFADGSASVLGDGALRADWVERPVAWASAPGHTTRDGLRGLDR